jgi:hypothetical protein
MTSERKSKAEGIDAAPHAMPLAAEPFVSPLLVPLAVGGIVKRGVEVWSLRNGAMVGFGRQLRAARCVLTNRGSKGRTAEGL